MIGALGDPIVLPESTTIGGTVVPGEEVGCELVDVIDGGAVVLCVAVDVGGSVGGRKTRFACPLCHPSVMRMAPNTTATTLAPSSMPRPTSHFLL